MARAYIALARGDIDDNMLQILDLQPNSSQRNSVYDGAGQTGYMAWTPQHDVVVTAVPVANTQMVADSYGLAAYLVDNVEDNDNANIILTDARANAIATGILNAVVAGTAVTLAAIDALIATATGGATSGLATADSTGTVEQVLRILGGEVYKVAAAATLSGAAAAFVGPVHVPAGGFVVPVTVNGIVTYPSDWRNVRTFMDNGYLHLSRLAGNLSQVAAATYVWDNPALTYGAAGTALFVDATQMLTTISRALVVYDATGAVITT